MNYKVITAPTSEPLTLAEVKLHLRLGSETTEDTLLNGLIAAAREYCESYTRRALAAQTIEAYLDRFPNNDRFRLPRPPLQSVASIKYTDSAGMETTMPTTDYLVDTNMGQVVLPYGGSWPSFTPSTVDPIVVTYVAGYSASTIPRSIKLAMLLLIGHWYENRETVLVGSMSKQLEFTVSALLSKWKAGWW